MKLMLFFEVDGLTEDEYGEPAPAGLAINLGEAEKQVDYQKLVRNISIDGVLKLVCLDGIVRPEDVRIITSEEYDEKYGDEKVPSLWAACC